jgi:hypothetical protein
MALEGSHPNFRLYLSADPATGIPPGEGVTVTNFERCI